jgi:hypothetical protein
MSGDKIILGKDTYQQLKDMLESPDEENAVRALSCIENSDFKSNITYVLLMMKEANVVYELWKINATETLKKYRALGILSGELTYKKIMEIILQYQAPIEDIQFFMNRFAEHMKNEINQKLQPGDKIIEQLTIIINPNEQSRTTSESLQGSNVEGAILRDVSDNVKQAMG